MPTLKEVLTKKDEIINIAKGLGFEEVRLFKSATPGYVGIYGIFSKDCPTDSYNRRSLALTYKISELIKGKAGVVSDKDDPDGSVAKGALKFDEQESSAFEKVFSVKPEQVIIEDGEEFSYLSNMRICKVHYDQLALNKTKDLKLEKEGTTQASHPVPTLKTTIASPSSSHKAVPQKMDERVKRKLPEIPQDITEYLSNCSDEEFEEAIEGLKRIRALHKSHQQQIIS